MANISKPIVRIHNAETDEIIDREMSDDEFAQYQANQAAQVACKAETEAKAQAKAAAEGKLAALGLTAEEIAALTK